MSKMKKLAISFWGFVVILFVLLQSCMWYDTFDVTGLTFYNNEPIREIFLNDDRFYVITEEGKGYVAGGYSTSKDRKYRNSESCVNRETGILSPVLFFDGHISKIFPSNYGKIMFLDDKDVLYELNELEANKICDNAFFASKSFTMDNIYVVDNSGKLFLYGEVVQHLASNVKAVRAYRDRVFVLSNDNCIYELSNGTYSEPIFSDVKSFDVIDTSHSIFNGETVISNDQQTMKKPLFNVLTNDGTLYAKGSYNLIYRGYTNTNHHRPYVLNEWTIIGEKVSDFSLAGMGTLMLFEDSTCKYFGFDTTFEEGSLVSTRVLCDADVKSISATNCAVCYKTEEGFFLLGGIFEMLFDACKESNRICGKHHILSGEALFLTETLK